MAIFPNTGEAINRVAEKISTGAQYSLPAAAITYVALMVLGANPWIGVFSVIAVHSVCKLCAQHQDPTMKKIEFTSAATLTFAALATLGVPLGTLGAVVIVSSGLVVLRQEELQL